MKTTIAIEQKKILHVGTPFPAGEESGQTLFDPSYQLITLDNTIDALQELNSGNVSLVVKDSDIGSISDIEFFETAKRNNPEVMTLLVIDSWDHEALKDGLCQYCDDVLVKPYRIEEYRARIRFLLPKARRRHKFDGMIVPVCWSCHKIRDDFGNKQGAGPWRDLDEFFVEKFGLLITRSYCPDCIRHIL